MRKTDRKKVFAVLSAVLMVAMVLISVTAMADVGNQNRYSSGSSSDIGGGDSDFFSFLAGIIVGILFDHPVLGMILLAILAVAYLVWKRKNKKSGGSGKLMDQLNQAQAAAQMAQQQQASFADTAQMAANSANVAAQIQEIDPMFSADKFTAWAREVFLKLQQAWTDRDWKSIRPFESEELFAQHNQQLDEYIRNNKINVVEKIGIKSCKLSSFTQDGDKEVVTVQLSAVMRDYVIDATTRKVLESDPNKDWWMNYEMVFNRKAGVKTTEGLSNKSTTNCPNCGAPTQITSAGQCEYCGSVITTGEHDWVLTDIHSI